MKNTSSKPFLTIPYISFFKRGLYWNLFDSLSAQGLVILFHILLRSFYGNELHGAMGCLLSLFYVALTLSNAGLDQSLAPFLESFTKSKETFRSFIKWVAIPQLFIVCTNGLFIFYLSSTLAPSLTISIPFSKKLWTILFSAFLLESMRKTTRTFLQLVFYNKVTAAVEIGNMILYSMFVLICYAKSLPLSLELLWFAFAVLVALQLIALIGGLTHFYYSLPSSLSHKSPSLLIRRMVITRAFTWAHQSMGQLFSTNLLVPLYGLKFGVAHASLIKVISTVSQWITLISQKTFGISSNALFAHLKTRSLATQQQAFSYLSSLLTQVLSFLLIFLLINGRKLLLFYSTELTSASWSLLSLMIMSNFLDSLFVLYEKWYIFEEEAFYLLFFNGISFTALYALLSTFDNPFVVALSVIAVRSILLLSITLFSSYRWNIWPSYQPHVRTLLISVLASLAFFTFL